MVPRTALRRSDGVNGSKIRILVGNTIKQATAASQQISGAHSINIVAISAFVKLNLSHQIASLCFRRV